MCAKHINEEAIFNAALEIKSPVERSAYLKRVCGEDTELLARLKALLKAHEVEDDFLKAPDIDPNTTLDDAPLVEGPGTVIDHYKLLEKIGEGGMASVYMAEQKEPVRRKVALKIIKLGMDTKQVITRFEVERQALAVMDHPHIAKVHDAGKTKTGRPYFVMELVKGVPITEYCDKNELNTRQRLDLFMSVCQAIQHAHQKGIIHRDIKPTNVLVTLHDGKPVPKVIDFGIAKATNQELTQKTLFTRFAQMIGTPEYMSPEQAEMSGLDIDTRTDIYSLGVLLYELLIGITPLDAKSLYRAGYNEIQRMIREQEPDKPSTKLSTVGEDLTIIAKQRHTSPDALRKQIAGDLDWVVMKSLEKDRTRRYATATEFAADIQRHINHEPVLAVAPSLSYKISKFIRRNRSLVTSAAAIFIVLVAGIVITTILAISRSKALDTVVIERDRAVVAEKNAQEDRARAIEAEKTAELRQKEAETALSVLIKDFSIAVMPFNYIGGEELKYLSIGIPDMLQQSLSYLHGLRVSPFESVWTRYGKEPQDPILVGSKYNVKGIVTGSIEAQGEDLNIQIRIVNSETGNPLYTQKFVEKLTDLTNIPTIIAKDITQRLKVQFTEEEKQRAFKVATNNPEAFMKYMKGRRYFWMRTAESHRMATKLFKKATDIDSNFAKAFSGLADIYMTQFQYVGANVGVSWSLGRKEAEKALELDNNLAEAHASMGFVLNIEGKNQQAIKEYKQAFELNRNYVQTYLWLGACYKESNNLKNAIETLEEGLVYDPVNFAILSNLGEYYIQSGQTEKGTELIISSIKLSTGSGAFCTSGGLLISQYGDFDMAIQLAEQGLELDPNTYQTILNAMNIYQRAGQYETAIDLAKRNVALYPDALNVFNYLVTALRVSEVNSAAGNKKVIEEFERLIKKYPQSPDVYNQLMIAYRNAGQINKAITEFESLVKQYPQSPTPFRFLGEAYRIVGEYDKAIEQHKKSIQLAPKKSFFHYSLGLTYNAAGKFVEAEEQFKEAIRYHTVRTPLNNIINNVRGIYLNRGENQKAVELYIDAINNDPDMNDIYYYLGRLYRDIYEYESAINVFENAVERFPDYAPIRSQYSTTLSYIGKHQEAIEEYQKVLDCIPYTWNANNSMGYRYLQAGEYENAIKYFSETIKIKSTDQMALENLSGAYLANQQYPEAAESYKKYFSLCKIQNSDEIFAECFDAGEYNQSILQSYLKKIMEAADNTGNPFTPMIKAQFYTYIGQKAKALDMLDAAFNERTTYLAQDVWLFWYDDLHFEPRFQELIKKLKLDKYFYK